MRQVGSLTNEIEANRFAAYLVTEGVSAHVEADGDDWPVWVHDENQVGYARLAFEEFLQDPNGAAYQGVEHQADEILAEERRAREQASRNVIQMRGRWNRGQARRRPLVMAMIIASVITFIASGEMSQEEGRSRSSSRSLASNMLFVDSARYRADLVSGVDNRWYEIQQGQVWRLITPAFYHFGIAHIVFNMLIFYQLASVVEERRGSWRFAALVVAVAAISNIFQVSAPYAWGGGVMVGGMSGVIFGIFGYSWMKSRFAPELGIFVAPGLVRIMLIWLFVCMTPLLQILFGISVANWAHGIGLLVGMAAGYFPTQFKNFS